MKKGQKATPEQRAKMSAAHMGHKPDPEQGRRHSEFLKALYAADPERKARQRDILLKVMPTPEEKSALTQAYWDTTPGAHEKRSAQMKARHARRRALGLKAPSGWKLTEETRKKQAAAFTGKPKAPAHRRKLSLAKIGKPINLGVKKSAAHRAAISRSRLERLQRDPEFRARAVEQGLRATKVHRSSPFIDSQQRRHLFRSSWELRFAEALEAGRFTWTYEADRISLPNGSVYIPDFYVTEWATYIEIKGYMRHSAQAKLDAARAAGHKIRLIHGLQELQAAIAELEART